MNEPLPRRRPPADTPHVLITGGAGFIGTNLAHRLAEAGERVTIYDNLARPGVQRNLAWLRATHGERISVIIADIRDCEALGAAVRAASHIYHLAAQVAVTTSLTEPLDDFDINARGTLNVLEAMRAAPRPPSLLFTSTNKVYGAISDLPLRMTPTRYMPKPGSAAIAIDEKRPLEFHSPYGCSKGTADQYVLDYARSYGLRTVVFRMSCIYGPHQCGTEDQGWVAHFLLQALQGEPITIYGDGRQVRDILYIDDLVRALRLAQKKIDELAGEAFNIGGGAANATSLLELIAEIASLHRRAPPVRHGAWRTGDQLYYVSDHGRFSGATGWEPQVHAKEGIARLYRWLAEPRTAAASSRTVRPRLANLRATRSATAPPQRARAST
jgi:CDP-paratose 2-epimerase